MAPYSPEHMIWMRPTQLDQPVALGQKIRPPGAAQGRPGPPKGPIWAKTGPFGGPRSAVVVSKGARAHDMYAAHPVGPTSGTWAQIRPPGAAQGPPGPPKGSTWAKTGPFGGPRSAVVVS